MAQIFIQNHPFTGYRGVRTQWGGNYVHTTGTGQTVRQAAFDALSLMPVHLFKKFPGLLTKMIFDLKDDNAIGQYQIQISIPCEIGPRQYKDGKYHPGKPDVIDHNLTIASADESGIYFFPAQAILAAVEPIPPMPPVRKAIPV